MNSELAKELKINRATGVYVDSLMSDGASKKAGIKEKDIIISIDDIKTSSSPELQEIIARKKPGEKVKIKLIRNGLEKIFYVTLRNQKGDTDIVKKETNVFLNILGVELKEITTDDKKKYGVEDGVKISRLFTGKLKKYTTIREGFVITSVNNSPVASVDEFIRKMETQEGGIMIAGKYASDPATYYYAFGM